jgi:hypothetical protein
MRFVSIAIFMLCLNASIAIVNAAEQFDYEMTPQEEWFEDVDDAEVKDSNFFQNLFTDIAEAMAIFTGFVKGLFQFVQMIAGGVIAIPWMLGNMGVPSPYTYYFSLPIYMIYLLGLAQFMAGRSAPQMR